MTQNKAQKRAVRARMDKTGERYTTARHYLLDLHHSGQNPDASDGADSAKTLDREDEAAGATAALGQSPLPPRVAEPGVSDAAVRRATGKGWDEWLRLLDAWDGTAHAHPEIARHLYETYGIDGWWAQNVTVGYERARGMRAVHERPDGFSVNASKTFPVPVERLFAAFLEPDERERWVDGLELRPRTNQPNKSARFDVLPGPTRLAVNFLSKGPEKAAAQLQQERLPSAAEVERWRAVWKEQLSRLASHLAEDSPEL